MITTTKTALAEALTLTGDIVERRNTIPILQNLLITRARAGLAVRMADLDVEATVHFAADAALDFEAFTVPAYMLRDIVRKLADGAEISIRAASERNQSITLRAGRSRFSLSTLPGADFPELPMEDAPFGFEIEAQTLAAGLRAVSFAISTEETRYYLNGVHMHPVEGGVMLVATDGHRLAKRFLPVQGVADDMPGIIIPRKTVGIIDKVLPKSGTVSIAISKSKIALTAGVVRVVSKLIDGTFPDYRRVVPQSGPQQAEIDSTALKTAIERVMAVLAGRGGVSFAFEGSQLRLTARDPDGGEAEDCTDFSGTAALTIGLNGKYLLDALAHLPDGTLLLEMNDAGTPAILRADGDHTENLIVIMPMRV